MQYADDTTAIRKGVEFCNEFKNILLEFAKMSGLEIDSEKKTEAIWFGPEQPQFKLPQNIKWIDEPIK